MNKSIKSPRKITAKGVVSRRVSAGGGGSPLTNSPLTTPRTPRKQEARYVKPFVQRKALLEATERVEVMELPARLVVGGNNINLKGTSGDRIRNGGGGDSCMRLPLDCMSKEEIKDEMKESSLPYYLLGYQEDDDDKLQNEEEDVEEEYDEEKMTTILAPDRARFNVWKGTNYDLHILGDFKSDFERRVKSFQRPETKEIVMDPFCRSESGLKDEPSRGEAFLVWKSNKLDHWNRLLNNGSQQNITIGTFLSSEEEDEDSETGSLPDPEIIEYIQEQKQKLKEGLSTTGELLYYDDEFGVVRNLHRSSHSLTNYGVMPDETWIGKANIFYPEMSAAEKKMLQAVVDDVSPKKNKASRKVTV